MHQMIRKVLHAPSENGRKLSKCVALNVLLIPVKSLLASPVEEEANEEFPRVI
jgi:hypothetical protein